MLFAGLWLLKSIVRSSTGFGIIWDTEVLHPLRGVVINNSRLGATLPLAWGTTYGAEVGAIQHLGRRFGPGW